MGTKRTATLIRVFGILSLGVLIGGAAGVGAMFLPSAKAAPVAAVAPAQVAPVAVTLPVAAPPPAREPAVATAPEVVAPVVAIAAPAPEVRVTPDVSRRVLSSVAFAKKKVRAAAKPAADAPKAADRADDEPLRSAGKATAEAKALEKAQLEALLR